MLKAAFEYNLEQGNIATPHLVLLEHPLLLNEQNEHYLEKATGDNWVHSLCLSPELEKYCPWDKLNEYNWRILLSKKPQYAKYCQILSVLDLDKNVDE